MWAHFGQELDGLGWSDLRWDTVCCDGCPGHSLLRSAIRRTDHRHAQPIDGINRRLGRLQFHRHYPGQRQVEVESKHPLPWEFGGRWRRTGCFDRHLTHKSHRHGHLKISIHCRNSSTGLDTAHYCLSGEWPLVELKRLINAGRSLSECVALAEQSGVAKVLKEDADHSHIKPVMKSRRQRENGYYFPSLGCESNCLACLPLNYLRFDSWPSWWSLLSQVLWYFLLSQIVRFSWLWCFRLGTTVSGIHFPLRRFCVVPL